MTIGKDFRNLINIVNEAQNYNAMMKSVVDADWSVVPKGETVEKNMKGVVQKAKEILKREDRMIWFLRLIKISAYARLERAEGFKLTPGEPSHPKHALYHNELQKALSVYAKKSGNTAESILHDINTVANLDSAGNYYTSLLVPIDHYLGLNLHEINTTVFAWQTPSELLEHFKAIEDEWKAEAGKAFEDNDITEIMKFHDGLAWYNLHRHYCDKEGESMGHCGNNSRLNKETETVLSLRRHEKRGDKDFYTPYLTFVLDENRMLGEMKGRGNDRPTERYHSHIKALLLSDVVFGIKGGGYLPENNFDITDLPWEDQKELLAKKPQLEGPMGIYRHYGAVTSDLENVINVILDSKNLGNVRDLTDDERYFILDSWSDASAMARSVGDDVSNELIQYRFEDQLKDALDNHDLLSDIFVRLSDEDLHELCDYFNYTKFTVADRNYKEKINGLISLFQDGDETVVEAFRKSLDIPVVTDDLVKEYINSISFELGCELQYTDLDSTIYLVMSVEDMCRMTTVGYEENVRRHISHVAYGADWDDVSDDMSYYREEEGLASNVSELRDMVGDLNFDADNVDYVDAGRRLMENLRNRGIDTSEGDLFN